MLPVAVAVSPEREEQLVAALIRHGYEVVARCESLIDLALKLHTCGAEVAVVSAEEQFLSDELIAEADSVGVRVVAVADTDEGLRFASSLGLYEVVPPDAGWQVLESMLAGGSPMREPIGYQRAVPHNGNLESTETHRSGAHLSGAPFSETPGTHAQPSADGAPRAGQVIAVWGPAGAPGRTTLAINLAAELAASGFTVALADGDTHSASVAPMLGLLDEAPGFAAACRLAATESLNLDQLERISERYRSAHGNFWVLTGIGRPSRWPELSAERVVTTLKQCRSWVDYTIVDTGSSLENDEEISSDLFAPRRNAATVAALREADQVVAVGAADPVGLSRFLRAHVELVELVETDRVFVVMNKVRASAIGSNAAGQITHSLERFGGIVNPVLIAHDQAALDGAVLSGKTLRDTSFKSAVREGIGQLASLVAPEQPVQVGKRRSLIGRTLR